MNLRGQKVPLQITQVDAQPCRAYKLGAEAKIHNRFDIEVLKPDGSIERAVAHNIVLNALWTRLNTNCMWFAAIAYGSGTGTLVATRTDLFTRISAKSVSTLIVDTSHFVDGYVSFRQQIQIPVGEITGQVIREVGISYDTLANHLMTHALLKDMNGNTVSITVGALDVVNIYATVYVRFTYAGYEGGNVYFVNVMDANGHLFYALAGVGNRSIDTSIGQCLKYWNAFSGSPDDYSGAPTDQYHPSKVDGNIAQKIASFGYTPATKKIVSRLSLAAGAGFRVATTELNPTDAGGWNGITIYSPYGYNPSYHSGICIRFPNNAKPYCTITDEVVGTGDGATRDFALDFGFILNDGSAVIKVNGATIAPESYAVDYGKPAHNKLKYFMRHISGAGSYQFFNFLDTSNSKATVAGNYEIAENPLYVQFGITSFYRLIGVLVEASNDLVNWVTVCAAATASGTTTVTTYKNYRYWRVSTPNALGSCYGAFKDIASSDLTLTHLHFAAGQAPANGATVTATYRTASIPKDTNHVVDMELEITLGEYIP